jgi:ABC-type transporter Mla MlaB component
MSALIVLPAQINATGLLPFISQLGEARNADEIVLDFSQLRRVTSAGLTALTSSVIGWRRDHRPVEFRRLRECAIIGYLHRMDLLDACGVRLSESFQRHEVRGRFVPVRLVDHDVTQLGREMTGCLAPGGEDYDHPVKPLNR